MIKFVNGTGFTRKESFAIMQKISNWLQSYKPGETVGVESNNNG